MSESVEPNMYRYDEFDARFVAERVEQFAGQVARRLSGELTEDQFKPLRLMNGLYLQLHAYMLRVAVPYGTLSSRQVRKLAHIARKYDKDFGHFTTRQNIQYNWIKLVDVPAILRELARWKCTPSRPAAIASATSPPIISPAPPPTKSKTPAPWPRSCANGRRLHPEFVFLPRKFKIAVGGSPHDRAALPITTWRWRSCSNAQGRIGYKVLVGGGMGRTPYIAQVIGEFVEKDRHPGLHGSGAARL